MSSGNKEYQIRNFPKTKTQINATEVITVQMDSIDNGKEFDFGRTSSDYAAYRNIYPKSMYDKLIAFGIGKTGQKILDLGSGTAILPINLAYTNAHFMATDISENQIAYGKLLAKEKQIDNIDFKVCMAENTGFADNSFDVVTAVQCFPYFDPDKATKEIFRILKPNGIFCKIFMDWLSFQDNIIAETEQFVLKYNPDWKGYGFDKFRYCYPEWAENKFDIETIHSYNETLPFSKEQWTGRIKSCRGIGASLSARQIMHFETEFRKFLDRYTEDTLSLKHQIHIEIYRSVKQ